MSVNCQFAAKNLLPAFRSIIAKQLITKHGLTQTQTANKLGITQTSVCNYINSKRATKCRTILGDDYVHVHVLACETAERIASEKDSNDGIMKDLCRLCMKLKK